MDSFPTRGGYGVSVFFSRKHSICSYRLTASHLNKCDRKEKAARKKNTSSDPLFTGSASTDVFCCFFFLIPSSFFHFRSSVSLSFLYLHLQDWEVNAFRFSAPFQAYIRRSPVEKKKAALARKTVGISDLLQTLRVFYVFSFRKHLVLGPNQTNPHTRTQYYIRFGI